MIFKYGLQVTFQRKLLIIPVHSHDHSWGAKSTLRPIVVVKSLLSLIKANFGVSKTLNSCDFPSIAFEHWCYALQITSKHHALSYAQFSPFQENLMYPTELMLCVISSPEPASLCVAVTTQEPQPACAHIILVPVRPK